MTYATFRLDQGALTRLAAHLERFAENIESASELPASVSHGAFDSQLLGDASRMRAIALIVRGWVELNTATEVDSADGVKQKSTTENSEEGSQAQGSQAQGASSEGDQAKDGEEGSQA